MQKKTLALKKFVVKKHLE